MNIKSLINRYKPRIYAKVNAFYPKRKIVVIVAGSRFVENSKRDTTFPGKKEVIRNAPKVEDNAIAMANYIAQNYSLNVYLIVPSPFKSLAPNLVHRNVHVQSRGSWMAAVKMLAAKYFFFTHEGIFNGPTKRQTVVNLWHGISNKKMKPHSGGLMARQADITVATSKRSQEFFLDIFNITPNRVFVTGYPRNDWMLQAKSEKEKLKDKIQPSLKKFKTVLIWMPTFRDQDRIPGNQYSQTEEVFSVRNLDLDRFQGLLARQNAICLVKPHHLVKNYIRDDKYKNILFVDDFWIYKQGISLYQLLACTDALITDYSSVMIDYTLLDQPIFCIADDLEEYRKKRGFYYDDFENYIPTKLLHNQKELLKILTSFLQSRKDLYRIKRDQICDFYFDFKDANSAKRIANLTFNLQQHQKTR